MCVKRIRNKSKNFKWKRALFGVLIVGGLIGGAGIKLVAPHGIVAFLSFSSIIVVLYAIFISMQSLQLARDTQRPFLNVMGTVRYALYEYSDEGKSSIQAIKFSISNEGAFPADEVSISCNVCKERGNDDWHLLSLSRENAIPSICFPHQEIKCRFEEKPDDKEALRIEPSDKLRVLITINYKNKITNKKHKTIRAYSGSSSQTEQELTLTPLTKEDYWD